MKKHYTDPELEIITVNNDVITDSYTGESCCDGFEE